VKYYRLFSVVLVVCADADGVLTVDVGGGGRYEAHFQLLVIAWKWMV
jgi:hypothetical protein